MKILFDQGVPLPLKDLLVGWEVTTAYREGWSNISNGELLGAAERTGVTVFLTTDQNLRYQQNLKNRRVAIVVLPTTRWPDIRQHLAEIRDSIQKSAPGDYRELSW